MRELALDLGIDIESVERSFQALRGFGRAYRDRGSESGDPRQHLLAATAYRRAAAHGALLGVEDESRALFAEATEEYVRIAHPYGVLLANLTLDSVPKFFRREVPEGPEDVFLLWNVRLLAEGFWYENQAEFLSELAAQGSSRVGVLGIPVSVLVELRDAAFSWLNDAPDLEVVRPLGRFLSYYVDALERGRSVGYLWQRLAMPFHPIEPDVMAVLVGLDRLLASADGSVSRFIPEAQVGGVAAESFGGACGCGALGMTVDEAVWSRTPYNERFAATLAGARSANMARKVRSIRAYRIVGSQLWRRRG